MGEHKCSSSGSCSARETVKVFKKTKCAIDKLESKLQDRFERRAMELGMTIRRGTKGNIPTKAEAVDLLFIVWKRLPEAERTQIIKDYINNSCPIREYLTTSEGTSDAQ